MQFHERKLFFKKNWLLILISSISFLVFLLFLLEVVNTGVFITLDQVVNTRVNALSGSNLVSVMNTITHLGSTYPLLIFSLILLIFFIYRKWKHHILLLCIGMIGGLVLELSIKSLVHSPRPLNPLTEIAGYSFVSGHSTMSTIFFCTLLYTLKDDVHSELLKYAFILSCVGMFLLIGFSRIYLNAHWLSDVLGGFALGIFWTTLVIIFIKYYTKPSTL